MRNVKLLPTVKQFTAAIKRDDAFERFGIIQAAIQKLMADKEFWAEDARVRREHMNAPSAIFEAFKHA
jgi:hypothetical protein